MFWYFSGKREQFGGGRAVSFFLKISEQKYPTVKNCQKRHCDRPIPLVRRTHDDNRLHSRRRAMKACFVEREKVAFFHPLLHVYDNTVNGN